MPAASLKSKYWCITLNNYTDEEQERLRGLVPDQATYVIFGREVGESGTPHLQIYCEFRNRKALRTVKNLVGVRAHVESRRGTSLEASDYCTKDEDYEVFGVLSAPQPGRRTDLEAIRAKIADGASDLEVAEADFGKWVIYRNSFSAYRELLRPPIMRRGLRVYVLWGESGTGKSRYAVRRGGTDYWMSPDPTLQWFDGYRGEQTVIIDDYDGGANSRFLLRLLDVYGLRVPIKGGFVAWNPTTIFITSNKCPSDWHVDITAPLRRRIHHVLKLTSDLNFNDEDLLKKLDDLFYSGSVECIADSN